MAFMNMSSGERTVRILATAPLLIGAMLLWPNPLAFVPIVLGVIALATGVVGWCPLYTFRHRPTGRPS